MKFLFTPTRFTPFVRHYPPTLNTMFRDEMIDNYQLVMLSCVRKTAGPECPLCDWFGFDWTCIFTVTALAFLPLPKMTRNHRLDDSITAFISKKTKTTMEAEPCKRVPVLSCWWDCIWWQSLSWEQIVSGGARGGRVFLFVLFVLPATSLLFLT